MPNRKIIGTAAMAVALTTGGIVGATLGNPVTSGAQDGTTTTTPDAGTAPDAGSAPADGAAKDGDHAGRGPGGVDLEAAATALGLSEDELRTELEADETLAEIATEQGVERQVLIDALVAAGEARLEEAKAALPERMAEVVDGTVPLGGRGGHGGPGGGRGGPGGGFGRDLTAAADALGLTEDELRTELAADKSLADIAAEQGVEEQALVDALVTAAKARLADAVENGTLTQEQADGRATDLEAEITEHLDDVHQGGPGGRGERPDAPADDDDTTTTAPGGN